LSGGKAAGLGRSEKYHARPRHLYTLLFENGCCYVGQTTDLKRRESQHRNPAGGWGNQPFTFVHLATMEGTKEQAEDHEYAWRYTAQRAGWRIYGKPPNVRVNTVLRMNSRRQAIARQCTWPSPKRNAWGWMKWIFGLSAAAAIVALAL
jgi:predicted GIY-YIG superfamily endonuclease